MLSTRLSYMYPIVSELHAKARLALEAQQQALRDARQAMRARSPSPPPVAAAAGAESASDGESSSSPSSRRPSFSGGGAENKKDKSKKTKKVTLAELVRDCRVWLLDVDGNPELDHLEVRFGNEIILDAGELDLVLDDELY